MSAKLPDIQKWIRLVRAEYDEIPGLSLTKRQAQRLWDLDADSCDAILGQMVAANYLRRTVRDSYVRADGHL